MAQIELLQLTPSLLSQTDEVLQAAFGSPESRLEDLKRIVATQAGG